MHHHIVSIHNSLLNNTRPSSSCTTHPATCKPNLQVRKPTNVVSTICDDRGEEPTYFGVTMSELIEEDYGIGDVLALLWFKRKLPKYFTKFMEM